MNRRTTGQWLGFSVAGLVGLLAILAWPPMPQTTDDAGAENVEQTAPVAVAAGPAAAEGSEAINADGVERLVAAPSTEDLPGIRDRKLLRVLVTYSRTDFFILPNGRPSGLQVELLQHYEKALNKGTKREVDRVRIMYVPTTFDRLLSDLDVGRGDIAAALLTVTPERSERFRFASGASMSIGELVVAHKDVAGLKRLEDLAGREVSVLRGSSYAEHLRTLSDDFRSRGLDPIRIREVDSRLLSEDILEMVDAGIIPITVVDDYKARLWSKVLPDIRVIDDWAVSSGNTVGWAVRKNNPALHQSLQGFAKTVRKGSLLGNVLINRYLKDWRRLDNPLADSEYSKFRKVVGIFSRYANTYQFDALAAVAQAYQESHLDHSRRSHRGAVGIMQLLPSTAADPNVGIKDISGLEDNIHAGVKYLAFLRDRYFSDPGISDIDRLAFGWAAYNAGPANVIKMRRRAEAMGLDPNVWYGSVEYAAQRIVGRETVHYVRNVLRYYVAYSLVRDLKQPTATTS